MNEIQHVDCNQCRAALTDGEGIPLWDGKTYCRKCLELACPGLADYALAFDELVEDRPDLTPVVIKNFAKIGAVLFTCPMLMLLAFGGLSVGAVLLLLFCVAMGLLLVGGPQVLVTRLVVFGSRVSVRDGVVAMILKSDQKVISAPVHECTWRFGKAKQCSWALSTVRQRIIIVAIPKRGFSAPWNVACGWSPQMMRLWEAFFTVAQVPRHPSFLRFLRESNRTTTSD